MAVISMDSAFWEALVSSFLSSADEPASDARTSDTLHVATSGTSEEENNSSTSSCVRGHLSIRISAISMLPESSNSKIWSRFLFCMDVQIIIRCKFSNLQR